ncbi:hypothetical protein [Anabaena sp. PCC 7108]|uniref:hypothetical protein n=1 Tax=Anabaena sp. PCC 7108 TaxID=163908 RepID=UPI00034C6AF5|nr:hypothetical protein [Anabaena sp. PCC 7108]
MDGFWWEEDGEKFKIIPSLIENAKFVTDKNTNKKCGVEFDYPPLDALLGYTELFIHNADIEDLEPEEQEALFQGCGLDGSVLGFNLTYS